MMRDLRFARWVSPLQHQAQLEAIAALTAAERARAERTEQHHVSGDAAPAMAVTTRPLAPSGDSLEASDPSSLSACRPGR
jgi:hypothetical protein